MPRHLVAGQAGRRQFGFHGVLHGGAGVIVGQVFGRELGEDRIGLHRQVIQRQVFGAERDSLAQIGHTGVQRLARQGEHHVQVHPRDGAFFNWALSKLWMPSEKRVTPLAA
ncbi:hypothetical protein G6F31_020543 [Rhizopus arrhizus]|nr:hypothetical protein G6F31_020543 [Rhizopus arrhizus]